MGDLTGMTVVVTGAGGGIGRATSERLAADGAAVAALDLDLASAQGTVDAITAAGGRATAIACDVGDEGSVRQAFAEAAAALGPVTGVFASAGIPAKGELHEIDLADWERVIRVNLTGVFLTVKHAIPSMLAAGGGSIVTVGSISAVVAVPGGGGASYKAAKGGVNLLTKSIAMEYGERGIRANCICPGAVDTGFAAKADPATPVTGVAARAPLRRRGMPEEIASVASFLLSTESSYMTGSTVMVDGGYTAV